jgi:hypothetical protein
MYFAIILLFVQADRLLGQPSKNPSRDNKALAQELKRHIQRGYATEARIQKRRAKAAEDAKKVLDLAIGCLKAPVCGQYWIWQWSNARGSRGERYFGRVCHSQIAEAGGESALIRSLLTSIFCFGLTGSTRVQLTAPDNRSDCIT